MPSRDQLIAELDTLPEPLLSEILDFVRLLKLKAAGEARQLAIASEPALARDWLRPEEDDAWRDL